MARIPFYKYHGAGNDFILIDNRQNILNKDQNQWFRLLCDRHFGIGADGLMLLEESLDYDFEMYYVNSDGNPSSMCGNGGRCIVAFAKFLGLIHDQANFMAIDGLHTAKISEDGMVILKMVDPSPVLKFEQYYTIHTGSPHLISMVEEVQHLDVFHLGKSIRNKEPFQEKGINVNFVQELSQNELWVRTYERGVENETLSCGTGVTASAIVHAQLHHQLGHIHKTLHTPGGLLKVIFHRDVENQIKDVYLEGPTQFVFEGFLNKIDQK